MLRVLLPISLPRFAKMLMPGQQRGTQRSAGVSSRRLNPNVIKETVPQDPSIGHAVQRHAAREAEIPHPRLFGDVARHPEHHFLRHILDRTSQVHISLGEARLRFSWWAAEELIESIIRHREPNAVIEITHVEAE